MAETTNFLKGENFFTPFKSILIPNLTLAQIFLHCKFKFDHLLIMKPTIGKRAGLYKRQEEKKPSAARQFVEINTHHNIVMKREFMYIEDVKEAININTLEERIRLKRWLIAQLKSNSKDKLVEALEVIADKDRHTLQKRFKISI